MKNDLFVNELGQNLENKTGIINIVENDDFDSARWAENKLVLGFLLVARNGKNLSGLEQEIAHLPPGHPRDEVNLILIMK